MNSISNYPLVSAIITTHNRCELLDRAVKSVKTQSYPNIEIIVVDDGSTDGTYDKYSKLDGIVYLYIEPSQSKGGNYARNMGINKSNGLYCAFLDDDDYWLPMKITEQVKLFNKNNSILIHGGFIVERITNDGIQQTTRLPNPYNRGDMHKRVLYNICCMTSNIIVRKDALLKAGLFDEELHFWQEYELTIRLAQIGNFDYVKEPIMVYRINQSDRHRLTNKYFEWRRSVQYIYKKHESLYHQLSLIERQKVKLLRWQDAASRSKASGLYGRYVMYVLLRKFFLIPFAIKSVFRNE